MAIEILKAIFYKKECSHQKHHDIESFLWVLCYALTKHTIDELATLNHQDDLAIVKRIFAEAFGHASLRTIITSRQGGQPADLFEYEDGKYVSPPVGEFLRDLRTLAFNNGASGHLSEEASRGRRLTHSALFERLESTIQQLEEQQERDN